MIAKRGFDIVLALMFGDRDPTRHGPHRACDLARVRPAGATGPGSCSSKWRTLAELSPSAVRAIMNVWSNTVIFGCS
jgi:hypothetical protein